MTTAASIRSSLPARVAIWFRRVGRGGSAPDTRRPVPPSGARPVAPLVSRLVTPLVALLLVSSVGLAGCAGLPSQQDREVSTALPPATDTPLGDTLARRLARHPGQSEFFPVSGGADALALRIALTRTATRTLDIQYYIFEGDDTGRLLLHEILAVGDRGVRVRLLLDDMHAVQHDRALAAIDAHPNIEVRLFNPFVHRNSRWMDFVTDFDRIDRRMHNKSMTADNQLTIVGGRNIGDSYFAAKPDVDFSDLDLMLAGPVVPLVSAVFDEYWNSASSFPLGKLLPPGAGSPDADVALLRSTLDAHVVAQHASPYGRMLMEAGVVAAIRENRLPVYWGDASVIADRAAKVTLPPSDDSTHAIPQLRRLMDSAQKELALVSPYFVPGRKAVKWFTDLEARGVEVRILTNSFAATDVSAVHAGYVPYRFDLLRAGVELYELKPGAYSELDGSELRRPRRHIGGSSRASLHAKSYMVDREKLFVGSLNLDPRSARLNTEMGVVVDSPALCDALGRNLDEALLDVAYKVMLEQDPDTGEDRLVWITREKGLLRTYVSEPGMSALQQIGVQLLRLLPIESEL